MTRLWTPERLWIRPEGSNAIDRSEVERRTGPIAPLEVLSGGLANLNVRIGAERVLRIYRRDPQALAVEAALLRHPWESFRTPAVLDSGEDFLALEYVSHAPLAGGVDQGAAAGMALAEVHRTSFAQAGLLSGTLTLGSVFPDVIPFFGDYALTQIDRAPREVSAELRPGLEAFLAARGDALRHLAQASVLLHGDFKVPNLHWTEHQELLVLDWEFAYSGPHLMDVGQLVRWPLPAPFLDSFAQSYRDHGGTLPDDWQRWAGGFDLFNLCGLLGSAEPGSRRATDVLQRMRETLAAFGWG